MQRTIPKNILTEEVVRNIVFLNKDADILKYVTSESIKAMAAVVKVPPVMCTKDETRDFTDSELINDIRTALSVGKIRGEARKDICGVTVTLTKLNDCINVVLLHEAASHYCEPLSLNPDWQWFSIEDIGSGIADDGTIYVSAAAIQDGDENNIPSCCYLNIIWKKDGTVDVSHTQWYTDSDAPDVCLMYDSSKQGFVQRPVPESHK